MRDSRPLRTSHKLLRLSRRLVPAQLERTPPQSEHSLKERPKGAEASACVGIEEPKSATLGAGYVSSECRDAMAFLIIIAVDG